MGCCLKIWQNGDMLMLWITQSKSLREAILRFEGRQSDELWGISLAWAHSVHIQSGLIKREQGDSLK